MKKFVRSERANLFEPNVYISMVAKLSGDVSPREMEQAVYAAYEANEATMSRIVLESDGNAYYEKMQASGCKFFADCRPWQQMLCESERTPFALNQGELVRVFLSEEDGQPVLFIHAHHLVGDGKSVWILLNDILRSLNKHSLTYKPMLSVDRAFLEKRAKLPALTKFYINRVNQKWIKNRVSFSWDDYYAVHRAYWDRYTSEIQTRSHSINEIKAKCPENVSINSYLIAELVKDEPQCHVIGIPVSIREDDGMSNQVSGITVKYAFDDQKTLSENAGKIHKAIYRKLGSRMMKHFILLFMERLHPSLTDGVLLQSHGCFQNALTQKMAEVMGYTGNGGRDLGVTNLNRLDFPDGNGPIAVQDILFVPPKVSYAKKVVGIGTYGDKLTVCCHNMKSRD